MWVHATLVDTSLLVYENYVGRLTPAERERYYDEQKLLGEQYGVPISQQPATYSDFNSYFDETVNGGTLQVTASLRDVAAATLKPQLPVPLIGWPVVEYFNLVTTALMPLWIREELGLAWGPRRVRLHAAQRNVIRRLIPMLPALLREFPPARSAERRVRAAA
jgi:uncharacterized protein (DUF2236 family)